VRWRQGERGRGRIRERDGRCRETEIGCVCMREREGGEKGERREEEGEGDNRRE